ncbi:hypothetical protein [Alishewanella tabrizica]|uniref:Lipoprotein n=1 Tax=Alishewanella tabrizica TaxID=671278 RepID=A0ABQ2WGT0_9ALTE|nr:hypothetical protein [Alishewanella tabrizica]GGW54754.1 hypothetical protein GCM10008111_08410 [Alishewanella tabrizica]
MKNVVLVAALALLWGCQMAPVPLPPVTESIVEPVIEPPLVVDNVDPEPIVLLAINEEVDTLAAWLDYQQQILVDPDPERARLRALTVFDEVAQLQLALLSLHPDMPYVTRFRIQTQFAEMVSGFPPRLASMFSWALTYNQKLLEAESAVTAVTRLNAQQQDALERMQKTNRDLQKKIDALTQIEAELNTPAATENNTGVNNGQR